MGGGRWRQVAVVMMVMMLKQHGEEMLRERRQYETSDCEDGRTTLCAIATDTQASREGEPRRTGSQLWQRQVDVNSDPVVSHKCLLKVATARSTSAHLRATVRLQCVRGLKAAAGCPQQSHEVGLVGGAMPYSSGAAAQIQHHFRSRDACGRHAANPPGRHSPV